VYFDSFVVKLLILLLSLFIIIIPVRINSGPSIQSRAEQLVGRFLAEKGSYMAMYFSNVDTAFTSLDDEISFKELSKKVAAYQDSTLMFSRIDSVKANSYYEMYRKLNFQMDSFRTHYKPRPLGYLILHHFQFNGDPWTDSFTLDFNLRNILKIKETIE
jgi:hypothetical protein